MITFIEDAPNITAKELVQAHIEKYMEEAMLLLPDLPNDIYIWLGNDYLIPETGEGGFAYASDTMSISFDVNFKDKVSQLGSLRATIFHEGYHLVQGHTLKDTKAVYKTALDSAIYEGCATVFAREYADETPLWGDYQQHDRETLSQWQSQLRDIPTSEYYNNRSIYNSWAFYDEDSGVRWRLYKVGTWLVDEALRGSGLDILDLRTKSAQEIISFL